MFKKTVQFEDLDGVTVQETFYFNFTKLEIIEMLEVEELEKKVKKLTETEDAQEAYKIFKDLIVRAQGEKALDNRGFIKNADIRARFEASPAMSEIIIEFIQNPNLGAEFIEKCLPPKMVAEAKAAQEREKTSEATITDMVTEADRRQQDPATRVEPSVQSQSMPETRVVSTSPDFPRELQVQLPDTDSADDFTHAQLVAMSQEEFDAAAGTDPQKMSQKVLTAAYVRKMHDK